jgi:hypothetical protein
MSNFYFKYGCPEQIKYVFLISERLYCNCLAWVFTKAAAHEISLYWGRRCGQGWVSWSMDTLEGSCRTEDPGHCFLGPLGQNCSFDLVLISLLGRKAKLSLSWRVPLWQESWTFKSTLLDSQRVVSGKNTDLPLVGYLACESASLSLSHRVDGGLEEIRG